MLKQNPQLRLKLLFYALLLIIPLSAILIYKSSVLKQANHLLAQENKTKEIHSQLQSIVFSPIIDSTKKLAQDTVIKRVLEKKIFPAQDKVLDILNTARSILDADIVYILDSQGTAVASTSYDEKGIKFLVGENYSFRPYFTEALEGKAVIYPALGVTTGERGLYFSYPITGIKNSILGVFVIKINLKRIDAICKVKGLESLLVTKEGIIFAASKNEWLFHHIYALDEKTKAKIKSSQQFADQALLPFIPYLNDQQERSIDNQLYSISRLNLPHIDWQLITFAHPGFFYQLSQEQENLFWIVSILLTILIIIIAYLYYNIIERHFAEKKLENSLSEKILLIKEIHHRVKNNFQIINGLLFLQSRHIEDPDIQKIFQESQDRIHSMTLIHEKLYQSENLQGVNFKFYLSNLISDLLKTYQIDIKQKINVTLEIEELTLSPDIAIPCGLLINELMTNSIKYAFPNQTKGEIVIKLSLLQNQMLQLIFKDNGIGIPEDIDLETSTTLGFSLINSFASKLNAEVKLSRDHGTLYDLTFPFNTHYK